MKEEIGKYVLLTYMKILSNELFVPLKDVVDKTEVYAPFHCMAQYFKNKGYVGIMHASTIYRSAKNVVLFDK